MELKYGAFVKRWYDELDNGKIYGVRCKKCGNFEYPPYYACGNCGGHGDDLEWQEISGKATVLDIINMPDVAVPVKGQVQKPHPELFNSLPGSVKLEEGPERSVRLFGINEFNKAEIYEQLPIEVEAVIVPHDGFHTVGFRYTGPGSMTDEEYAEKKGVDIP